MTRKKSESGRNKFDKKYKSIYAGQRDGNARATQKNSAASNSGAPHPSSFIICTYVYTQRGFVTFSLWRRRQSGHASLCVALISVPGAFQKPATRKCIAVVVAADLNLRLQEEIKTAQFPFICAHCIRMEIKCFTLCAPQLPGSTRTRLIPKPILETLKPGFIYVTRPCCTDNELSVFQKHAFSTRTPSVSSVFSVVYFYFLSECIEL